MTGLVAGVGWRMIAGKAASNAVGDVRAAGRWLGSLDLIHVLALALAILLGVDHVALVLSHRHTAKVELQLTAANNALTTARANVTTLKVEVAKQNTAVADLGTKSAAQQKAGAQASQVAAGRAAEAQATSDLLKQSSRSAGLKSVPAAPCEPSDTLKGQWK